MSCRGPEQLDSATPMKTPRPRCCHVRMGDAVSFDSGVWGGSGDVAVCRLAVSGRVACPVGKAVGRVDVATLRLTASIAQRPRGRQRRRRCSVCDPIWPAGRRRRDAGDHQQRDAARPPHLPEGRRAGGRAPPTQRRVPARPLRQPQPRRHPQTRRRYLDRRPRLDRRHVGQRAARHRPAGVGPRRPRPLRRGARPVRGPRSGHGTRRRHRDGQVRRPPRAAGVVPGATPDSGLPAGWVDQPEIARQLEVTERTVKAHCQELFDRLGTHNRTGAVVTAMQWGLLDPAPPGR